MEGCPTKVLVANAEGATTQSRRLYEAAGLNEREIQIVQGATPKRQYYVVSPEGRRLIALGLGQVALSFVAVNNPAGREKVEGLVTAVSSNGEAERVRHRGRADWACW